MSRPALSHIEAVGFPPVLGGRAATLMALQHAFAQSQWWPAERLRDAQFAQLRLLLAHARAHNPFHAERLAAAGLGHDTRLDDDLWRRIPILSRAELREHAPRMVCAAIPPSHGATSTASSSGSTGIPIRVTKSALSQIFWEASLIREEEWHRADTTATIARLHPPPSGLPDALKAQANSPQGVLAPDWGPPCTLLWKTGRIGLMTVKQDIAAQAAFVERIGASYIYTFPSNLQLLKAHYQSAGRPPPRLRAIWTGSEILSPALRQDCESFFACPIVDTYSTAETGYLALQCPQSGLFHIQSETVKLEILDPAGHPCPPGQTGRVVVTPLHNFAMPLLRYEIGDEAEFGPPCPCGRGLPTLGRVIGRTTDYLVHPDGRRTRASQLTSELTHFPNIAQYQIIQRSLERIEVMIAANPAFTPDGLRDLHTVIDRAFEHKFHIDITFHPRIPIEPGGKLRPFKSDLPEGLRA